MSMMRGSKDVFFMRETKVDIIKATDVTSVLIVALYSSGESDRSQPGMTLTSVLLVLHYSCFGSWKGLRISNCPY